MRQHDRGRVATLLNYIPGLWSSFSFLSMPNLSVYFLDYFPSCAYSFGCSVGVPWLLYWLFLLEFLVIGFYGMQQSSLQAKGGQITISKGQTIQEEEARLFHGTQMS